MCIGKRIKDIRLKLGMTQESFAGKIGLARNSIASYEVGRRYPITAVRVAICKAFGVSLEWLETGVGEKENAKDDALQSIAQKILNGNNAMSKKFLRMIALLDDNDLTLLESIIDKLSKMDE